MAMKTYHEAVMHSRALYTKFDYFVASLALAVAGYLLTHSKQVRREARPSCCP
jgi:hypothetical protein